MIPIMKDGALLRAFKNVTNSDGTRPTLSFMHLAKDGAIEATNSHVLLRINHFHDLKQELCISPRTLAMTTEVSYPDTSRLIPEISDVTIIANVEGGISDLMTLLSTVKTNHFLHIVESTQDNRLKSLHCFIRQEHISGPEPIAPIEYHLGITELDWRYGSDIDITLNTKYMLDCLTFFKAYLASRPASQRNITISYNGHLRPLLIEGGDAQYLITPVRTY